jgi:predicted transcriptional regulator
MKHNNRAADSGRRPSGSLESEIMAALWAADEPLTAAQVHDVAGTDLSYKTVLTVLVRLHEKGQAERTAIGRSHVYQPHRAAADAAAERMSIVLERAGDREGALQRFLGTLNPADEQVLRAALTANPEPGTHAGDI